MVEDSSIYFWSCFCTWSSCVVHCLGGVAVYLQCDLLCSFLAADFAPLQCVTWFQEPTTLMIAKTSDEDLFYLPPIARLIYPLLCGESVHSSLFGFIPRKQILWVDSFTCCFLFQSVHVHLSLSHDFPWLNHLSLISNYFEVHVLAYFAEHYNQYAFPKKTVNMDSQSFCPILHLETVHFKVECSIISDRSWNEKKLSLRIQQNVPVFSSHFCVPCRCGLWSDDSDLEPCDANIPTPSSHFDKQGKAAKAEQSRKAQLPVMILASHSRGTLLAPPYLGTMIVS